VGNDDLDLASFSGYTPLQVLASVALENREKKDWTDEKDFTHIETLIMEAAEFLVRHGARLSIDAPPDKRLRRSASSGDEPASPTKTEPKSTVKSTSKMRKFLGGAPTSDATGDGNKSDEKASAKSGSKIRNIMGRKDSNDVLASPNKSERKASVKSVANLRNILDSDGKLKAAEVEWNGLSPVNATDHVSLVDDGEVDYPETDAPGGSNERSCAICWKPFGKITNRKHKCRVTLRFVCDDCSTKRLKSQDKEWRISDGQFLLGMVDAAKEKISLAAKAAERDHEESISVEKAREEIRRERLQEEESNRTSLFGDVIGQASNFVFGEEREEEPQQKVKNIMSSMSETRNALIDRGEKINSLGDKSARLVEASSDFARMAKELRKKQSERGIFW